MSLKDKLFAEGMKLSSNPAVSKLMQDERFMRMIVAAMSMPGRFSTFTAEQRERFAKEMGLATSDEVRDLKRQIGALEDTVRRLERRQGER